MIPLTPLTILLDISSKKFLNEEEQISHTYLKIGTTIKKPIEIKNKSNILFSILSTLTFKNNAAVANWDNSLSYSGLVHKVAVNLTEDPFKEKRANILKEYHPYTDGNSAIRMVDAVEAYIENNGVPEKRVISWFRRYKITKIFGKN